MDTSNFQQALDTDDFQTWRTLESALLDSLRLVAPISSPGHYEDLSRLAYELFTALKTHSGHSDEEIGQHGMRYKLGLCLLATYPEYDPYITEK